MDTPGGVSSITMYTVAESLCINTVFSRFPILVQCDASHREGCYNDVLVDANVDEYRRTD